MMYIPLMNQQMLVRLLIIMLGYIAIALLIMGILCLALDYIDSRKD